MADLERPIWPVSAGHVREGQVLHVLRDTMAKQPPSGRGLMMAMGPGFCSELLLLNWH